MPKIQKITINDIKYPVQLKQIANPPKQLYVLGDIHIKNIGIAVVGSRTPSSYGKQVTPKLVYPLAQAGLTIVSGLALGIDGIAHETALEAGGHTIAVLGSGIDDKSIYPAVHKNLARNIVEKGGAIISEYAPGTPPEKYHFPERNRIIVGLSKGILVVEAKEKSGALITARLAAENNRDVFAVPGPITSQYSYGPNSLIQCGARITLDADDIFDEYGLRVSNMTAEERISKIDLTKEEKIIIEILNDGPAHMDKIIAQSNINASSLSALLVIMEMRSLVKNLGEGIYGL